MTKMQDARAYANEIFTQVSNEYADTRDLDLYLAKVIAALFELSTGAREHISDFLIADLCQELGRLGEERAMRAVLMVQRDQSREV